VECRGPSARLLGVKDHGGVEVRVIKSNVLCYTDSSLTLMNNVRAKDDVIFPTVICSATRMNGYNVPIVRTPTLLAVWRARFLPSVAVLARESNSE
jgi:hypothetical protein